MRSVWQRYDALALTLTDDMLMTTALTTALPARPKPELSITRMQVAHGTTTPRTHGTTTHAHMNTMTPRAHEYKTTPHA